VFKEAIFFNGEETENEWTNTNLNQGYNQSNKIGQGAGQGRRIGRGMERGNRMSPKDSRERVSGERNKW